MSLPEPAPDLVSLDLLDSVVRLGSIRRAASAHGISQPAASMRLRALERRLGLELLDRSSGRACPTLAGEAVAGWGRHVLVGVDALRHVGRTQLRIAASMTVAEYLVPGWLHRLAAADPALAVSLQMGNSGQVVDIVAGRGVDVGFVEGERAPVGMDARHVAEDSLVLVVAPAHPWARRRRPVTPQELARTPLVLREAGSGTREVLEAALRSLGLGVTARVELGSTTAIKAATAADAGPAVLSSLAVRPDVEEGRLVVVPTAGLALKRAIRAVWKTDSPLPASARRLLAVIARARP
jgi:DNA-binding transcriptional LysR family regulator